MYIGFHENMSFATVRRHFPLSDEYFSMKAFAAATVYFRNTKDAVIIINRIGTETRRNHLSYEIGEI